jgi:subfamily B ATP-binding cassette protein MsbA
MPSAPTSGAVTKPAKGHAAIPPRPMMPFVEELVRPYRASLLIVLATMLVETLMSLAAPWPLKLVLDDALGNHKLPAALEWAHDYGFGRHTIGVALFAGALTIVIAVFSSVATYIDNYFTESVGQYVANDLRIRIYEHLHRLSLAFYDRTQTGTLLSTITNDVATVQNFASASTLGILVDLMTIVGMLGLMFWLNWDFTLVAVAVTPFLLLFVMRFKKAVKEVQREVRKRQSDVVAVVQQGLGSVRVVEAFGRQDLEAGRMTAASRASVTAALKARRIKSLLSPVVTIVVALCTGFVLWRGTTLIVSGAMTAGALTVFLAYLSKFFKPVQDLAKMTNTIAQTSVALERIQAILAADQVIPEHPDATDPGTLRGEITFEHVAFGYEDVASVLRDVNFTIKPGQVVGIVGPRRRQVNRREPHPAFLRPDRGTGADRRRGHPQLEARAAAARWVSCCRRPCCSRARSAQRIAYGRPNATEGTSSPRRLASRRIHRPMPHGYDSVVGRRGDTLSGGQRQRIGSRGADPSPILILDEAALDTESGAW